MTTAAIVPASGTGDRMGAGSPKQFLFLGGMPLLARTLSVLEGSPSIDMVLTVVPDEYLEITRREIIDGYGLQKCLPPAAGGPRRQDSVRLGFEALPPVDMILVHDGVRPFLDNDLIDRCLEAARETGAALCAVEPPETVKSTGDGRLVERTLDRKRIRLAQTPQAFLWSVLLESYGKTSPETEYTDEAALAEAAGFEVRLAAGNPRNIKITTPEDLAIAEALLSTAPPGVRR